MALRRACFLALLALVWVPHATGADWKHAVQACSDAAKRIQQDRGVAGAQEKGTFLSCLRSMPCEDLPSRSWTGGSSGKTVS